MMFRHEDDDEDTRQILCERCRKFVSLSDIKYLPKGNDAKMALCRNCLKNFNPMGAGAAKKAPSQESSSVMSGFFCGRCNYKFKFNTARDATLRCPYCGRADKIVEQKTQSASHLLRQEADF